MSLWLEELGCLLPHITLLPGFPNLQFSLSQRVPLHTTQWPQLAPQQKWKKKENMKLGPPLIVINVLQTTTLKIPAMWIQKILIAPSAINTVMFVQLANLVQFQITVGRKIEEDSDSSYDEIHLNIHHTKGAFNYASFPDCGSGVSLINPRLASKHGVKLWKPAILPYLLAVNGRKLNVICLLKFVAPHSGNFVNTKVVVSPDIEGLLVG